MSEVTGIAAGAASSFTESLGRLMCDEERWDEGFEGELRKLGTEHGDEVYAELLYLLTNLRFDPPDAREHWVRVADLRLELGRKLGAPVDFRTALVEYFLGVNRKSEGPRVMELKLFQDAVDSTYRDGLTGLYNYRYFGEHLKREVERIDRYSSCLSLVMIDVDDFKVYNDMSGHQTGDGALTTIAAIIGDAVRTVDIVCRYGGEEFMVILPSTPKDKAKQVSERIRQRVEGHPFPVLEGPASGRLTVSLGVATYPVDGSVSDDLVGSAHKALYVAKSRGKNRVQLCGGDHRTHHRVEAALKGELHLLQAETQSLETQNLSMGGMLFTTDRPLVLGSLIEVSVELEDGEEPLRCAGRVVWVSQLRGGVVEVAIRNVDLLPAHRTRLLSFLRNRG